MSRGISLKTISFLSFLISYQCTNECKHCALQASPNQVKITLKLEDLKRYMEDITANYIVEEVGFFGGEPLLNLNLLISFIKEVKRYDISKIGLPTNGYWGKSDLIAKKYALKLKKAGLNKTFFSVDAFHQEFTSLNNVRRAISAAYETGIERIGLLAQTLGFKDEKNVFNEETNKIIDILSKEFEFCKLIVSELRVRGRAAIQLTRYYSLTTIPSEKCLIFKFPFFMVDPYGWVFHQLCYGICIGNTKKKSLSEIIREFNYRTHPIIGKIVINGGPKNLLELAIEKGYKPQNGYADKYHLFYSAQKFLRPFYPNVLEPSNIYC